MDEGQAPPEKKNHRKTILVLIAISALLIFVLLGAYYFVFVNNSLINNISKIFSKDISSNSEEVEKKVDIGEIIKTTPRPPIKASFNCDDGRTIDASFYSDEGLSGVDLVLSDGNVLSLYQVESGSGARYANEEGYVFWNSGNEAFLEKDGEKIYTNCQEKT